MITQAITNELQKHGYQTTDTNLIHKTPHTTHHLEIINTTLHITTYNHKTTQHQIDLNNPNMLTELLKHIKPTTLQLIDQELQELGYKTSYTPHDPDPSGRTTSDHDIKLDPDKLQTNHKTLKTNHHTIWIYDHTTKTTTINLQHPESLTQLTQHLGPP